MDWQSVKTTLNSSLLTGRVEDNSTTHKKCVPDSSGNVSIDLY